MNNIETMKLALEALQKIDGAMPFPVAKHAIKQLRQAIEQAEQAPVARKKHEPTIDLDKYAGTYGGYTSPPPSQPLTSKQIREWWASENGFEDCNMARLDDFEQVVRAVEGKHGIKGVA